MCMILDVNMWSDFIEQKSIMQPVHQWLEGKNGKLLYSDHESFQKELTLSHKKVLKSYYQSGHARFVPKKQLEKTINSLRKTHQFKSNDMHILGLAKVGQVKVLCTKDKDLHHDFKQILGGNIYQNAKHQHLLTQDTCP